MTSERSNDELAKVVSELRRLTTETEWAEFKANNNDPRAIGEYISALANSAALREARCLSSWMLELVSA